MVIGFFWDSTSLYLIIQSLKIVPFVIGFETGERLENGAALNMPLRRRLISVVWISTSIQTHSRLLSCAKPNAQKLADSDVAI